MPRASPDCYRPFVCTECSRAYTRSHDLLRHQRKHKGEYISYDDEAALKRHLARKHKGGDGSRGPLADVQVFVESGSQGSSRAGGHLVTPPLTQGSSGSEDSRSSTAGPSTPTVVASPQMRDMQISAGVVTSDEDWWSQKLFSDEGAFGPFPPGMPANESVTLYHDNRVDHRNTFTPNDTSQATPSQYGDSSTFTMAPWPGWDMQMPPYYPQFFNGSESGV
ncbi:hypothetical protein ACEPAG_5445 [Sanghuangporus baumii]